VATSVIPHFDESHFDKSQSVRDITVPTTQTLECDDVQGR